MIFRNALRNRQRLVTWRKPIVWLAHAPGLWFFFGESLSQPLRRANLIAILLTLIALAGAVVLAPDSYRLLTILIVWAICHVLWGSYLAWKL